MSLSTIPFALAVDDHPVILESMCAILDEAGFRCYKACDGDAAIGLLGISGVSITLLFSDVEMPGSIDGFTLARHVADHYPWIEIVIASGTLTPKDGDLPAKAIFIAKPFCAEMVHDHLRQMLPDGKKPEPLREAA